MYGFWLAQVAGCLWPFLAPWDTVAEHWVFSIHNGLPMTAHDVALIKICYNVRL
jgi:hypothetical protein